MKTRCAAAIVWLAVSAVGAADAAPRRVVSLIPAATEMIYAIGAADRLVGVSSYDRFPPEATRLPHVGGLIDPDVERILALRPDLVILYDTQTELKQRLERARIPFYSYQHRALPDILQTIRALGSRLGATDRANALASELQRSLDSIRASVAREPRPSTLLVFGRDPGTLRNLYASGGYGFLNDLLGVAGGDNVFADLHQQSVQAGIEMILARKPQAILELRYGDSVGAEPVARIAADWNALPSLPAVRNHRVFVLVGDEFVVPGPRIADAARRLAAALHPEVSK